MIKQVYRFSLPLHSNASSLHRLQEYGEFSILGRIGVAFFWETAALHVSKAHARPGDSRCSKRWTTIEDMIELGLEYPRSGGNGGMKKTLTQWPARFRKLKKRGSEKLQTIAVTGTPNRGQGHQACSLHLIN